VLDQVDALETKPGSSPRDGAPDVNFELPNLEFAANRGGSALDRVEVKVSFKVIVRELIDLVNVSEGEQAGQYVETRLDNKGTKGPVEIPIQETPVPHQSWPGYSYKASLVRSRSFRCTPELGRQKG
jgi:hypothetical protein